MPKATQSRDQWALKGAVARLKEIDDEVRAILDEFPELRSSSKSAVTNPAALLVGKKRRTMSPEVRKKMSAGMRKFWARRKAAAKTKGAST